MSLNLVGETGKAGAGRRLMLGDVLCFGDSAADVWVVDSIDPPHLSLRTPDSRPQLRFQVSLNEEHSSLSVDGCRAGSVDLGERAHHYSLLTLARQRLADAQRGIEPEGQGWIETERLSKMLGMDVSHLNIHLHRARTQISLAMAAEPQLPDLVQRRRGELRLAAVPFKIVRGACLEGEFCA